MNISVEYIDHMGDDLRVANVARVSFNKWKEELDDKDVRLIDFLAKHEHNSPFRHTAFSIRCKAPIFLARQLGKHQVGLSWNEVSRRYVDTDIEHYIPTNWRKRPEDGIKQGSGECFGVAENKEISDAYLDAVELCEKTFNTMIEDGVAPEMARMVLPQSMMVSWVWTGSLEAFFHVYRLRSGEGAQQEAKEFSTKLEEITKQYFPHCWEVLRKYS